MDHVVPYEYAWHGYGDLGTVDGGHRDPVSGMGGCIFGGVDHGLGTSVGNDSRHILACHLVVPVLGSE
jgi:hypothetical protein